MEGSTVQSSYNKVHNFKLVAPQVLATLIASLTHVTLMGFGLGYSSVFITQIQQCENISCTSEIYLTQSESSWIASIFAIFIPIGAIFGSTLMDSFGRLNLLVTAIIPGVIGWSLIALANGALMMILGRIFTGIAGALTTCSALVYIAEITTPKLRGSMGGVPTVAVSLGVALVYTLGYWVHWRIIAWFPVVFSAIAGLFIKLLPENPAWLVSKGRIVEAEKSLNWINKYYPNSTSMTNTQLEFLIKLKEVQQDKNDLEGWSGLRRRLSMFLEPTVYKPLFILPFLNLFVQFSGVYVILYYAALFFEAAGTNIDPNLAAICFGIARFIASLFVLILLQRYPRRLLMIISGLGMTASMVISALFTKWIQEGSSQQMWVPLTMIVLYVIFTMVGFLIIPLAIPAELFPTAVRGMAQSISLGILYALSFAALISYSSLNYMFQGSSGLQFFYAGMSICGVIYTIALLPETHHKELHEIGEYFKKYTFYLAYALGSSQKRTESTQHII